MSLIPDLQKKVLKLTLSLYNNPHIRRNAVQEVITNMHEFISETHIPYLHKKVTFELQDINSNIFNRVYLTLQENRYPFQNFSTEHQRFKMYKKYSSFTYPSTYKIGEEMIFEIINRTEIRVKYESAYGVYVPLQNSIKKILETLGLFVAILNYVQSLQRQVTVSNVMQGQLWSKHRNDTQIIPPIFYYYDDFDPGNTLGSHAGQQQLGGGYVSLPFLPLHLVAKLSNILISSIFYTKHRKVFVTLAVFQRTIDDINDLCTNGVEINVNGQTRQIFFKCVMILGDNLGLNCICGFTESFSAKRYCRVCRATNAQCKNMTEEDPSLLRTVKNYDKDIFTK